MIVRIIVGSPASGKSTFAQQFVKDGYVRLNRDSEGGRIIDLLPKMEVALSDGRNIVLDNTFPTKESRKPFIDLAKKFDATVICTIMCTPIEECIKRNELRQEKVKVQAFNFFRSKYEIPIFDEGYDKIEV